MKRLAACVLTCILTACAAAGCFVLGPMAVYIGSGATATGAGEDAETGIQAPASQPTGTVVSPLPVIVPAN